MKNAVKRKVGRPSEQKVPHRPVLAARVPQEDYEVIAETARLSGRTMSEEVVWRVRQSFEHEQRVLELENELLEWRRAHKDAQEMLAKTKHVIKETTKQELERELRRQGYHFVRGENAGAWFPPGVDSIAWIHDTAAGRKIIDAERERVAERAASLAAERAAERAIEKFVSRMSGSKS